MLPRRHLAVAYILLSLCPVLVTPQLYLKVAVCAVFAGGFIYQGCAESVNIVCRLVALGLNLVNCRAYPCTNYGSNEDNACTSFPTGCPLEYIKMFGLCAPFKICCGTGGVVAMKKWRRLQALKRLGLLKGASMSAIPSMSDNSFDDASLAGTVWDEALFKENIDLNQIPPELGLPKDPTEYMSDWPKNTTDPSVLEEAIRVQYEKFMRIHGVLNAQEVQNGMEPLKGISYQDYRAVGLGEKEIHEVI